MKKKLLKDLTAEDVAENQVWKYLIEENIEYVQASDKTEINEDSKISYIVLTEFILNNKKKYLGFCSPQDTSGIDYIQPVIFAEKGQFAFYKENNWSENDKLNALKFLGLNFSDIFPVEFKTKIKCDNKFYNGTIVAFNCDK